MNNIPEIKNKARNKYSKRFMLFSTPFLILKLKLSPPGRMGEQFV
jgi:hypothetical protein